MKFLSRYQELSNEIEEIYTTSNNLRIIYEDALKNLLGKVNDRIKQGQIKPDDVGSLRALVNVTKESVESSEQKAREKLYPQGIILLVSISEQLLKELFETLFREKFLEINKLKGKKYEVQFEEIVEKKGTFSVEDFQDKILDSIYGDKNPSDKLNLQNAKSIEGVFKGYFDIDLELNKDNLASKLHYFYQIRHTLVHNSGFVDTRFKRNLDVAGIESSSFEAGKKIEISKEMYDECKEIFYSLFKTIEDKASH